MKLCLDVGNSQLFGGVFEQEQLKLQFRHQTRVDSTSDQLGVFLKGVLRENNINSNEIKQIGISSVVPSIDYSLRAACIKYFSIEPFTLQMGVKTGLKVRVSNPAEVGANLIATAIAACAGFPNRNIIAINFGSTTTAIVINSQRELIGVVIQPGMNMAMRALQTNTAKLPAVSISKPESLLGRTSVTAIQSGLYYGQLGSLQAIIKGLSDELFEGAAPIVIGTGGFAYLFEEEKLFDTIMPDLLLHGIRLAIDLN